MIYTSYHRNYTKLIVAGLQPINISVMFPKFVTGFYPSYGKLAPTYPMLKMSNDEYYFRFNKMLAALDPSRVVSEITAMAEGKEPCLCCYEKDHLTCHRSRVAEWLREAGFQVQEYGGGEKEKPKPVPVQAWLF